MQTSPYFFDPKKVPYRQLLEDGYEVIRKELLALIANEANESWTSAYPQYVNGATNDSWRTFDFLFFGIKNLESIKKCPATYQVIQQIPEIITAQFSFLSPKTHILPHKGYSKIILRNHLPLIVPDGEKCGIKIVNETHHWKEGQLVTFDDSFEHEAWNNSDEYRVVLMFDVAKPNCGYNAQQICKYKLENLQDKNLLALAPKEKWLEWFENGGFIN